MGADIENSIIGIRSYIGDGTVIQNSVVMGTDYWKGHFKDSGAVNESNLPLGIGKNCVIKNTILDKNVRLGDDIKLINEKGLTTYESDNIYIRDGIIVIPKGVTVPSGTVL